MNARRLSSGVAGLAMVGALLAPMAVAQEDSAITEVGWWSRRPAAMALPDGGFEVAHGLGSDQSVAALGLSIPANAESVLLTLTESSGFGADAALRVCTTTEPWEAANPGAWDDAPKWDCGQRVPLLRGSGGTTWSGDVTGLVARGGSLMIVPDVVDPGDPFGPSFQVVFSDAALRVATAPPDAADTAPAADAPNAAVETTTAPDSGVGSVQTPAAPEPAEMPDFGDVRLYDEPLASAKPPSAQAAAQDEGEPVTEEPVPTTVAGAPDDEGQRPWGRIFVLVPLSAIAGLAVAGGRRLAIERGLPFVDSTPE